MDTLSHAAWGYATLHRKRGLAWWGALAGAAPDLLWFIPSRIEAIVEKGWAAGMALGRERNIWRADGPPLPPDLVEAYHRYYVHTHSLVWLAAATAALSLTRHRRLAWLAIPCALHIVMDMPTHERYLTQPLYPLSTWQMVGLAWSDPRIFIPNVVALLATFSLIAWRRASARVIRDS